MSRVLQLLSNDVPGGVPVLAEMVATGLRARGHAVETLALRADPGRVLRHIVTGGYDAVLSYQVAAGIVGGLLGRLAGVPARVAQITTIPSAMQPHWRLLDRWWGQWGLNGAIVANSQATAASVACYPEAYRMRLQLVPHGVEPLPQGRPAGWRDRLGIQQAAPLLVTAGRLAAQKNQALLVSALAHLPDTHLAIAGDGPLRNPLLQQAAQRGVSQRLHLVGNLDRDDLACLLAEADIFVFPSNWESFGLVAVEAGMAGLPIVATDLPVLREVLGPAAPAGTIAFHPPGDPGALAGAVRFMLADYPSPASRAAAAIRLRDAYAVERMIDDYCRLLAIAPARN